MTFYFPFLPGLQKPIDNNNHSQALHLVTGNIQANILQTAVCVQKEIYTICNQNQKHEPRITSSTKADEF